MAEICGSTKPSMMPLPHSTASARTIRWPSRESLLRPGQPTQPVVLVEDNGPIHTGKSMAALAARAHWLGVEWLPSMRRNSTTSRWSGTTSRRITWHIRHLPTLTRWTGRSTTP